MIGSLLGIFLSPLFFVAGLILTGQLISEVRESGKDPNGVIVAARLISVIGIIITAIWLVAAYLVFEGSLDLDGSFTGFSF